MSPKSITAYLNISEMAIFSYDFDACLDSYIPKALTIATTTRNQVICYYLECIAKKLSNRKTAESESQLGELLDEPFLAVTFGQRHAHLQRERQLAVDLSPLENLQINRSAPAVSHLGEELRPTAVKERHLLAHLCAHHVLQMVGLRAVERHTVGRDGACRMKAVGHAWANVGGWLSAIGYPHGRLADG